MTTVTSPARRIEVTQCATLMRQALATEFKGHSFSVRKKNNSVAVEWVNGPTEFEVKQVCKPFTSASFDASEDLQTNRDGQLNGERVRFAADYVFPARTYTVAFTEKITEIVCAYFDVARPTHFVTWEDGDAQRAEWNRDLDIANAYGSRSLLDLCRAARYYFRENMSIVPEDNAMPSWVQYLAASVADVAEFSEPAKVAPVAPVVGQPIPEIEDDPFLVMILRLAADASQYVLMERFHAETPGQCLVVLYVPSKQRFHFHDRPYEAARKMLSTKKPIDDRMYPIGIVRNGVILAQCRPLVQFVEETRK